MFEIIFGEKPELINAPKILALGDGREILRTKTEGSIKVNFNINLQTKRSGVSGINSQAKVFFK